VTQRGNRRQQIFLNDEDYGTYPATLKDFPTCRVRKHERTGRSLGGDFFVEKLEVLLSRKLKPQKTAFLPLSKASIMDRSNRAFSSLQDIS